MKKEKSLLTLLQYADCVKLFFTDAHSKPSDNFRRFDALGKMIVDIQPDAIIDGGDFSEMETLNIYKGSQLVGGAGGSKFLENKRYKEDIEASITARKYIADPLKEYNIKQKKNSKKQYMPRFFWCEGNHEQRIRRVPELIPQLEGWIDIKEDLIKPTEGFGFEHHNFLEPVDIEGIIYSHYFVTGTMGKPISGKNKALKALEMGHRSCVWGHSHEFDAAYSDTVSGERLIAINGGCFQERNKYMKNVWCGAVLIYRMPESQEWEYMKLPMEWILGNYL